MNGDTTRKLGRGDTIGDVNIGILDFLVLWALYCKNNLLLAPYVMYSNIMYS